MSEGTKTLPLISKLIKKTINLGYDIGEKGAKSFSLALSKLTNLKTLQLDLHWNCIGVKGMKSLCLALS